jgi:hypothetical protein
MRLFSLVHSAPCSDHAYEDSFWPRRARKGVELIAFRSAVADGTSTTSFSGIWAQQLVLSFASGRLEGGVLPTSLRPLQGRWLRKAQARLRGRALSWYADAKLKQGAASTLLGLDLRAAEPKQTTCRWRVMAVGDSCLAHVRQDRLLEFFPFARVEDFTNHPDLISTRADAVERFDVKIREGEAAAGDSFYLMTDALAKWFLKETDNGEKPWEVLRGFEAYPEGQAFSDWVRDRRQADAMDDDDVTVLRLDLCE